jgi:hypothetical protein
MIKYAYSYITEIPDKTHVNVKFDVKEPESTTSLNTKARYST